MYLELSATSNTITSGRNAIQKKILSILRKIEHSTQGNKQAWYDTFIYQQTLTKLLLSYPKNYNNKMDDSSFGASCDLSSSVSNNTNLIHHRINKRRSGGASNTSSSSSSSNSSSSVLSVNTANTVVLGSMVVGGGIGGVVGSSNQQSQSVVNMSNCNSLGALQTSSSAALTACQLSAAFSSQEHELDDILAEWANMTGFLSALGSVWLPNKQHLSKHVSHSTGYLNVSSSSSSSTGANTPTNSNLPSNNTSTTSLNSNMSNSTLVSGSMDSAAFPQNQMNSYMRNMKTVAAVEPVSSDLHYCPVTQFIGDMLRLLTCQNEKFGYQIQRHVQDLLGHELNTQCYPILFEQIKFIVDKFFDSSGQIIVSDQNTLFIENTIFIMKCVLESKNEPPNGENPLASVSVENLMINIVKYVRHLDCSVQIIQIKTKVCQLVEAVMKRREDLLFRQEMKFRNKLVEYLTDWIMGNSHQFNVTQSNNELTSALNRDLDQASMEATATLLAGLPLQPEENDKGDIMEAKSQLFLKYFTLFMNLLNDCSDDNYLDSGPSTHHHALMPHEHHHFYNRNSEQNARTLQALRNSTIVAMSNLLNANIESGLMRSIALGLFYFLIFKLF